MDATVNLINSMNRATPTLFLLEGAGHGMALQFWDQANQDLVLTFW
jgi:hypothetical protein